MFLIGSAINKFVFLRSFSSFFTSTVSPISTKIATTSNYWATILLSTHSPKVIAESSFFAMLLVSETSSNNVFVLNISLYGDIFSFLVLL
jgi:hypothetical protein